MIDVCLVDDEPLALELHEHYLQRMSGFSVVARCTGAAEALRTLLADAPSVDLVLLDMTMPDGTGLDVLRHLRARRADVDVIAITAVRDGDVVRQMISLGVVNYLVKPFGFATFAERLESYREFRSRASGTTGAATQNEIDALLTASRPTSSLPLPKGLSAPSLERVTAVVRSDGPLSAAETAARLGMSRVSARRYLEHLADSGVVGREPRYGTPGRPETAYRWRA